MKLYTEEQVNRILFYISPLNENYKKIGEVIEVLTPIELPSDKEIEESETDSPYNRIDEYNYGFIDGANWVKQFIINQNNNK